MASVPETACDCQNVRAVETAAGVSGYIHSEETCGTVDGPGVRYVLFLSGCPLRCQYCHNPDAQGKPCGGLKSSDQVMEDVRRYKNFLHGGGLTISGGEPLMQAEFVEEVFRKAKAEGIHTALDTSGFLGHKASDALLEHTDVVLLDIKSWRPMTYKMVTGCCIEPTLKFAKRLEEKKIRTWVRFVLVPGLTDHEENIDGVAQFAASLSNVERVDILPFHKMGEHKYKSLGIPYRLEDTPSPTPAEVERAVAIMRKHGLEVN